MKSKVNNPLRGKSQKLKVNLGQSLLEVVLSLFVITLIVVAVVSVAVVSIRNVNFSQNKTLAARYAQEGLEWLRGQRDGDWDTFYSCASSSTYRCLDTLPSSCASSQLGQCGSADIILGTNLRREASFTLIDTTNVEVEMRVFWSDGAGEHEVRSITSFTNWTVQQQ